MSDHDQTENPGSVLGYPIEYWVAEPEIDSAAYFKYWNDEEAEKRKQWHVLERGFEGMDQHLRNTGLLRQLDDCLNAAAAMGRPVRGIGADLACGVFWTVAPLLKSGAVEKLYGVEYSRHRLLKIAPSVLQRAGAPTEKVVLCLGSFYHLKLPDRHLDFVILAEAFHHADHPEQLLAEIRRALKPEGVALILGEHIVPHEAVLHGKNAAKRLISFLTPAALQRRLLGHDIVSAPIFSPIEDLLKPDPTAGDHYYLPRHYREIFSRHGFDHRRIATPGCPFQGFVLTPRT